MRKGVLVSLVAIILVLAVAAPSFAWTRGGHGHWRGGSRVVVGLGFGFAPFWGPYPWGGYPYAYPYAYPYPAYAYGPPTVVVEPPPVYVQQQPAYAPPAAPQAYWYYCPSMSAYYPSVPSCAEPWVKVPPRP